MKRAALLALALLAGCATTRAPQAAAPAPTSEPAAFSSMQWLYGSGEGAAASIQAYNAFRDYVLIAARVRPRESVVLAADATLENPRFIPCADRPVAVVLDVDETAIQNLGYEYDRERRRSGYTSESWNRWEQTGADRVAPMPGAVTALRAIRDAGVTVIFNTNRRAENAEASARAIDGAGLGPARHRETLWLRGDAPGGSAKDSRRALISARYCVVAMAGDQLGDFSDLFNAEGLPVRERRRLAGSGRFARLWGNGWFMLSNPVYGPSLAGELDEIFSTDVRWTDPQGGN